MVCSGTISGFIISKQGNTPSPKKIEVLIRMPVPKTPQEILQWNSPILQMFHYNFAYIMALITKLFKKVEMFEWTVECQTTQEDINNQYIQAPIFINPNWELEIHVHINAFQLVVRAILAQKPICKINQHVIYSLRQFNFANKNYTIIKRSTSTMVYALHKFKHYLLGNMFTFYVDHMALVYLVNKPHIFGKLIKWILLFLEYDFKIILKMVNPI